MSKHNYGFTLIEIIISLAILSVGILAVLALFPIGFDAATRSADLTKAAIIGQEKMEAIKMNGYPVTAVASGTATSDARFTYEVQVSDVIGIAPGGKLQQATVIITWIYKGRTYNENFVTLIPNYSP